MNNKLDKLVSVPLREIWKHEAIDFTQWLAMQENLDLLAEEIGMDLLNPQTEVNVGSFNVDILAEDVKVVSKDYMHHDGHKYLNTTDGNLLNFIP